MHQSGFVYNSLGMGSVVINYDEQQKMHVSLSNFSNCSKLYEKNGDHIKFKAGSMPVFERELPFASLNQMELSNTSRKDDLVSLCYLLTYILNNGHMPFKKEYGVVSNDEASKIGVDFKTLFCKYLHYKRQVSIKKILLSICFAH